MTTAQGTGQDTADAPAPGYGALFRVPEFRSVFLAHLFSLLGVVVSEIALSVLVYGLTGSPFLSALTFALGFLPYLFGGTLLAGVADRYPARRVLVVCDLVCALCAALMALPLTPIAGLLVLRVVLAAVAPVFSGTRMATLADILGDGDLFVLGRSLLRIVSQSALLVGYGAGGVLLTVVSPRGALLVTVTTFLLSATLLRLGTRRRPARVPEGGASVRLLRHSLDGVRLLLGHRPTRALLLLFWVPPLFVVAPEALAAPYAAQLGVGSTGLGLLMCAMAVGTIGGELLTGTLLSPAARARIALPLAALTLLPLVGYAAGPGLVLSLLLLVAAGAGSAYTLGLDRWFVDTVPQELRGRAMTIQSAGLMTLQGVGMAGAGAVAEFFSVRTVVAGVGVLGTVCCALLAVEAHRARRAEHAATVREESAAAGGTAAAAGDRPGPGSDAGPKGETGLTTM